MDSSPEEIQTESIFPMHDSGFGTGACSDVRVSLILETCLSLKGGPLMWSSRLLTDTTVTSVFRNRWTFKVLLFPMMDWHPSASKVIVSSTYSCEALNPRRSSFQIGLPMHHY